MYQYLNKSCAHIGLKHVFLYTCNRIETWKRSRAYILVNKLIVTVLMVEQCCKNIVIMSEVEQPC